MIRCTSDCYLGGCGFDPSVQQHTFVEIGHEIISTAIICLPLIHVGQLSVTLLAKGCALSTGQSLPRKSVVRLIDHLDMTIDWDIKPSHAAIKISINATAAEFICKNIFPTPVQIKKIIKNKIGDIQQIYLYQNVCK